MVFNKSSLLYRKENGYNGGGWISALEKIIQKNENIHLGVAFEYESSIFKDSIEGVDYYPICVQHNFRQKLNLISSIIALHNN